MQSSAELVCVTDLNADDAKYYRGFMRKTRMEVWRGLKGSSIDKERGLWLNRDKRIVGPILGVETGDVFFFRMELCVMGLHGQPQAGIDYLSAYQSLNGEPITMSVIVSGGYEDDEDTGREIIYSGHGKLEWGNLELERSMLYGIKVRVIRGIKYDGSVSGKVYVYDGLYRVVNCWFDMGKSGFGVFKFRLVKIENQPSVGCECAGGCVDGYFCAMKGGSSFADKQNGILVKGKAVIVECGPHCRCPVTCRNCVNQKGVRNGLEVFRSRETGWGVRLLDLIQAGAVNSRE
ncbi:hypothetical protein ACH5RR_031636 [Cinchona calisaya]|uniref:Uncharacterized protein n=1 Tax=Cinchona calisaya TaxID=153742 RepID=A0ABD2YIN0_9GENT